MAVDKVHIEKTDDGQWWWQRYNGHNGKALSQASETYVNKSHAVDMAVKLNPQCEYVVAGETIYPGTVVEIPQREQLQDTDPRTKEE